MDKKVTALLREHPTPELLAKLHQLAQQASDKERLVLAEIALTATRRGMNVNDPYNGLCLYLFCCIKGVSLKVLQDNHTAILYAVHPHWVREVRHNIRSEPTADELRHFPWMSRDPSTIHVKVDDQRVLDLAKRLYDTIVKATNKA